MASGIIEKKLFDTNKIKQLLIEITNNRQHRGVIVTAYRAELKEIQKLLTAQNLTYTTIQGGDGITPEKLTLIKNKEIDFVLMNIKVGAGFDGLQHFTNYMYFFSSTWSYIERTQMEGRINRTGQKKTCFYIDFISADTIEEKIYKRVQKKENSSKKLSDTAKEIFQEIKKQKEYENKQST